ncbi:MAG: hypothetical protein HZA88_25635 [Verrucomicrobia bacterium]|nr:hypothetical protein [Verrucomicrobiota bacterium]
MNSTQTLFGYIPTGNPTLDELLIPEDNDRKGIVYYPGTGLFGVIFGAAGSGKSILTLQLSSGFAAGDHSRKSRHAVYVTHEHPKLIEEKIRNQFGFVQKSGNGEAFEIIPEERLPQGWRIEDKESSSLAIVQMPLDPKQQREKLAYLFRILNERFCWKNPSENTRDDDPKQQLLVCVDNAETISEDAYAGILGVSGKAAGRTFYKRLREYCARHRLNTWFVFEERHAQDASLEDTHTATTDEAYAADIVIRLGMTVLGTGYRERSFEIVKAKNQSYRRGRHHFSIRDAKHKDGGNTGIVIYRSLATQLYHFAGRDMEEGATRCPRSEQPSKSNSYGLGIVEVDNAVSSRNKVYLDSGTVSVLVSDLDSLASQIALHFALQDQGPTLYISTLHRERNLQAMIEQYSVLKTCMEAKFQLEIQELLPRHISEGKLLIDIERWIDKQPQTKRVVFDNIFPLAAKFPLVRNERHFLTALFELFRHKEVAALVVDMVEVGEGRNPLNESFAAGLADHVFVLRHVELQSQPRKIFSVLKLAGCHEPPQLWELEQRKDRIHAEDRLAFFKGVLTGKPEPVEVALSLYADTKDSPLHEYLETQRGVLRQTFGQNIRMHTCHPEAYVALQQSLATQDMRALGDCHVISMDEIWLEELIHNDRLADMDPELLGKGWEHASYITTAQDLALYLLPSRCPNWKPSWKQSGTHESAAPNLAVPIRNNFGILAYNPNVWRFPLGRTQVPPSKRRVRDLEWIQDWAKTVFPNSSKPTPDLLDWEYGKIQWEHLVELQKTFLRNLQLKDYQKADALSCYRSWEERQDSRPDSVQIPIPLPDWGVFTFSMENRESCVCFFLELLLSVLPKEQFPVDDEGRLRWETIHSGKSNTTFGVKRIQEIKGSTWGEALALLLHLLAPWDIHRLADAWFRPSRSERPCLFSRQWFSSWGVIGLREPGLWVKPLPDGAAQEPTPVSGAWYLGILRGSSAIPAGVRLIKHLTTPEEELYKVNRGIGLPVRAKLYKPVKSGPLEIRPFLPYREQLAELAVALKRTKGDGSGCPRRVLKSRCPFYRPLIQYYSHVSPMLMGMMVCAARTALKPRFSNWLWQRDSKSWPTLRQTLERIVKETEKRYLQRYNELLKTEPAASSEQQNPTPVGSAFQTISEFGIVEGMSTGKSSLRRGNARFKT